MYLIYKTDAWHSYASRDIIGIASSPKIVTAICKQQAKKEGSKITKEQLWNLKNIQQTQDYKGEGEFQFEEIQTDILL